MYLKLLKNNAKISYAQCGEDLIVDFIFQALKTPVQSYLDLGAHHPTYLSNTFYFYQKGCSGVCVEPDPALCRNLKKARKRDICLNVGVGVNGADKAKFYLMSTKTLSTFSQAEAERYVSYGHQKIQNVIELPLVSIHDLLKENFKLSPNFVSLDVEGLDLDIVKNFPFSHVRPEVFCIETITYTENNSERKLQEIIDCMEKNGYLTYADTYINTIFVNRSAWNKRPI